MKKFFALIIFATVILVSCTKEIPPTSDILKNILDRENNLPSGDVYLFSAPEGNENYTPDSILSSLYGHGSVPVQKAGWLDFSIFVSNTEHPCEIAIFLCRDYASALDTSKMLCDRLQVIKNARKETRYEGYAENGKVIISDNYCILIISENVKLTERVFLSTIG